MDGAILAYSATTARRRRGLEALRGPSHRDLLARGQEPLQFRQSRRPAGRAAGTLVYDMPDEDGRTRYYETCAGEGDASDAPVREQGRSASDVQPNRRLLEGHRRSRGTIRTSPSSIRSARRAGAGTRKAFPGLNVSLEAADDGFDHLVVLTEGEGDSGTYWSSTSPGRGRSARRGLSGRAGRVGRPRDGRLEGRRRAALHGVLTLPPGRAPKNLPLMVMPHGGPQARDYLGFDWWAQAFASRGYAVFQPNFRGSGGYGQAFATPASASGAARCRPIFPTGWSWPRRGSSIPSAPASSAEAMAATRRWRG